MNQKSNVAFYVTIFKNGAVVKRSFFSKPYLIFGSLPKSDLILRTAKGEDLVSAILYWKEGKEANCFIFFDCRLRLFREIAAEREGEISRASLEIEKNGIKIQMRSVLTGEPPNIEIPKQILKASNVIPSAKLCLAKREESHQGFFDPSDLRMISKTVSGTRHPEGVARRISPSKTKALWGLLLVGILSGGAMIFNLWGPFGSLEPKEKIAEEGAQGNGLPSAPQAVQKIDKTRFFKVLQKNRGDIEQCQFEHRFQNGTVKYRGVIDAKGKVSELSVLSDDIASESLLSCLSQKIRSWKFPASIVSEQTLFFSLALKKER
jgi:hypothetical protein